MLRYKDIPLFNNFKGKDNFEDGYYNFKGGDDKRRYTCNTYLSLRFTHVLRLVDKLTEHLLQFPVVGGAHRERQIEFVLRFREDNNHLR